MKDLNFNGLSLKLHRIVDQFVYVQLNLMTIIKLMKYCVSISTPLYVNFKFVLTNVEPCQQYRFLNDTTRSNVAPFQVIFRSDKTLDNGWYRFGGSKNSQMMHTTCIKQLGRCGTVSPGWMTGKHPTGDEHPADLIVIADTSL